MVQKRQQKKNSAAGRKMLLGLICVVTYAALLALLFAVMTPEQYDLIAGQVSPITITASKDVVDSVTTQQMIDTAMAAVPVNYTLDDTIQPAVMEEMTASFDSLNEIRGWEIEDGSKIDNLLVTRARQLLPGVEMSADDIELVRGLSDDDFDTLKEDALAVADELLTAKVAQGGESEAVSKLERELIGSDNAYSEDLTGLVSRVASVHMKANMLLDEETTEANRQKAAEAVEPVIYLKGRNIVRSGEIITRAQIAMLDSLGMLKNTRSIDILMYVGVALLVLLLLAVLMVYAAVFVRDLLAEPRKMALISVIILVSSGVCVLLRNVNQFLMPMALGVMLTAVLIKPRIALMVNVVLAVLGGLITSGVTGSQTSSFMIVIVTTLVSGSLCVGVIYKKTQRVYVLLAGVVASLSNMGVTLAVGLITEANRMNVLMWSLWSAAGGMLSCILCIGFQPALEWVFNLVTAAKLMELSNPNHPLIRRMILEASGTYHHSIIVANLAEAAANSIGASGLLARVGAYYHDVGKLKRPLYFKENQIGDNPHDRTDPAVSAAILTAHPTDGVALAEKFRMPGPILDIIRQHHGDTPMIYFYDRSVKENGAENVDIDDFRYPGPRPQTREAAIVMLADTIEAAARTAQDRTPEGLETLIRKLIRGKMEDGQLNESPMTLSDIEKATKAFVTVLSGVFHQRVEYPDVVIPPKKHGREVKEEKQANAEAEDKKNA